MFSCENFIYSMKVYLSSLSTMNVDHDLHLKRLGIGHYRRVEEDNALLRLKSMKIIRKKYAIG